MIIVFLATLVCFVLLTYALVKIEYPRFKRDLEYVKQYGLGGNVTIGTVVIYLGLIILFGIFCYAVYFSGMTIFCK